MADELKRENQRERAVIDPVLKFLFDKEAHRELVWVPDDAGRHQRVG